MAHLHPDTAWVLLIVGVLGVYFELCSTGWVFPGVGGAVLAALSAASLARMHAQFAGAVLLVLGMMLLWVECRFRVRWICGVAGTAALVWGAVRLVDGIHVAAAVGTCVPFAIITSMLLSTAMRARRNKQTSIAIQPH